MVGARGGGSVAGAAAAEGEEVAEGVVAEGLGAQRRRGGGLEVEVGGGQAAHLVVGEGVGADRLDVAGAVVGVGPRGPARDARGGGHRDRGRAAHQVRVVGVGVGQVFIEGYKLFLVTVHCTLRRALLCLVDLLLPTLLYS